MVANKILKTATAFMFESPTNDVDFHKFFPALLNLVVAEALPYENAYRAANGMDELLSAPVVDSVDSEVDYCDEICRIALPYGVASYFWQDENNEYRAQDFRNRFIDALKEAARAVETDAVDAYKMEE